MQDAINSDFEIKGTQSLYVCDASIFNNYAASNIHSSVILIADIFLNKFIKNNGENIIEFISNFEDNEFPYIYASMVNDNTVPLSLGEWGRPSFSEFMEIPKIIKNSLMLGIVK